MSPPKVELLVLTTCVQCQALKKMLDSYDIVYELTNVDLMAREERDVLFQEMKPYNEKKAFPITFIGNKAIIGFQKEVIMDALGLRHGM